MTWFARKQDGTPFEWGFGRETLDELLALMDEKMMDTVDLRDDALFAAFGPRFSEVK